MEEKIESQKDLDTHTLASMKVKETEQLIMILRESASHINFIKRKTKPKKEVWRKGKLRKI